jgi:hypothetical protein
VSPFFVQPRDDFASFCFANFRIAGHEHRVENPRHPGAVCPPCLKQHCAAAIRSGRLFVKCPAEGCGRSLQTLELRYVVEPGDYGTLVTTTNELKLSSVFEPSSHFIRSPGEAIARV